MVELFVRLGACLGILGLGAFGCAPPDVAWKASAILAAVSILGWRIDAKGLMNSGFAGLRAVAEALVIAFVLAGAGWLHQLGFLVLIPCVNAGARFGSPMISMAPLAASAIVGADSFSSRAGVPSVQALIHAAGVLSVSLLLGQRRTVIVEVPAPEAPVQPQLVEDGLLQVRESYRNLRDAYSDLERRSRKDKVAARIAKTLGLEGLSFYAELCAALKELSKAEELAVYSLAQYEQMMVVRGVTEQFPGELKDHSLDVDLSKAPTVVREQAEDAIAALTTGASVANVLLVHNGRIVGMACAIDTPSRLEEIRRLLNEAAPFAAKAIATETDRQAQVRRVAELELLYELGSITSGASTPATLADRVTREIRRSLGVDGVAVTFIENGTETVLAHDGSTGKLIDCMSFFAGPGIEGWIASGHPELVLFDARQDARCDAQESLKRRIGSFVLVPLWAGAEVLGYLSAHSRVPGGIDQPEIATLRLLAAELSRAMERLVGTIQGGLMTPKEFAKATAGKSGVLVFLEPLRKEQMIAAHGFATYEEAIRKLAHQVRAKLPAGGALCRRDQGDFLVFLDTDEGFARNWANEVAATASFIAVSTSDPGKRVPLALRAKVARMTTQFDQVSAESAA